MKNTCGYLQIADYGNQTSTEILPQIMATKSKEILDHRGNTGDGPKVLTLLMY